MKRTTIAIGILSATLGASGAALVSCSSNSTAPQVDSGAPDVTTGDSAMMTNDAQPAGDSGSDAPVVVVPPLCDPAATWNTGVLLGASTANLDRFGSTSADELSIAWMVPSDTSDGGVDAGGMRPTGDVYYADRATVTDAFGAAQKLAPNPGYYALDRVALSADGLRIVVVRADGLALGEVARATRAASFGAVDESLYVAVNISSFETVPPDTYIGDPVLAPSGKTLVFSVYGASTTGNTIFVTLRDDLAMMFRTTAPETSAGFEAAAGLRRRPSGISADERTLFFWDEIQGKQRAAWRDAVIADYTQFVDLGPRMFAQPNPSCRRIYYSDQGASSVDLFSADAK